ncbi:hypothetical protein M8J76_002590 [Diaphorina citri]|nr:hypothetical protein M8J76_002590 [Diaphorina citri]
MKMFLSKEDDDPFESIEDAEVFSVSYLNSFIMFVENDNTIQQFLKADKCNLLADNYLLTMTFAYFLRAKIPISQFSTLNFFTALHIAHDMEEDSVLLKRNLCNWTANSYEDEEAFYANRKRFLLLMDFRVCVSRQMCDKVMSMPESQHSLLWQRKRCAEHEGAFRRKDQALVTCDFCRGDKVEDRIKRYYQPFGGCYQSQSTEHNEGSCSDDSFDSSDYDSDSSYYTSDEYYTDEDCSTVEETDVEDHFEKPMEDDIGETQNNITGPPPSPVIPLVSLLKLNDVPIETTCVLNENEACQECQGADFSTVELYQGPENNRSMDLEYPDINENNVTSDSIQIDQTVVGPDPRKEHVKRDLFETKTSSEKTDFGDQNDTTDSTMKTAIDRIFKELEKRLEFMLVEPTHTDRINIQSPDLSFGSEKPPETIPENKEAICQEEHVMVDNREDIDVNTKDSNYVDTQRNEIEPFENKNEKQVENSEQSDSKPRETNDMNNDIKRKDREENVTPKLKKNKHSSQPKLSNSDKIQLTKLNGKQKTDDIAIYEVEQKPTETTSPVLTPKQSEEQRTKFFKCKTALSNDNVKQKMIENYKTLNPVVVLKRIEIPCRQKPKTLLDNEVNKLESEVHRDQQNKINEKKRLTKNNCNHDELMNSIQKCGKYCSKLQILLAKKAKRVGSNESHSDKQNKTDHEKGNTPPEDSKPVLIKTSSQLNKNQGSRKLPTPDIQTQASEDTKKLQNDPCNLGTKLENRSSLSSVKMKIGQQNTEKSNEDITLPSLNEISRSLATKLNNILEEKQNTQASTKAVLNEESMINTKIEKLDTIRPLCQTEQITQQTTENHFKTQTILKNINQIHKNEQNKLGNKAIFIKIPAERKVQRIQSCSSLRSLEELKAEQMKLQKRMEKKFGTPVDEKKMKNNGETSKINENAVRNDSPENNIELKTVKLSPDENNNLEDKQDICNDENNNVALIQPTKYSEQIAHEHLNNIGPIEVRENNDKSIVLYNNKMIETYCTNTLDRDSKDTIEKPEVMKNSIMLQAGNTGNIHTEVGVGPELTLVNQLRNMFSILDTNRTIALLDPLSEMKDLILQSSNEVKALTQKIVNLENQISNKRKLEWEDFNPEKMIKVEHEVTMLEEKGSHSVKNGNLISKSQNQNNEDDDVIILEEKIFTRHNIQMVRRSNPKESGRTRTGSRNKITDEWNSQCKTKENESPKKGDKVVKHNEETHKEVTRKFPLGILNKQTELKYTQQKRMNSKTRHISVSIAEHPNTKEKFLHLKIRKTCEK